MLAAVTTAAAPGWVPTTIKAGDSLWSLAQQNHTTVAAIKSANGISGDTIYTGETILLPPGNAITPVAPKTVAPGSGASTPNSGDSSAASVQAVIRASAARYGVDPALALGIAYQESGFRMSALSKTGARGVMQLMPATAAWAGATLVHRNLNPANLQDNVDGGVAYLHWLEQHSSNPTTVIGAYYQGLTSLLLRGPYTDTTAYVRSVTALSNRYR